MTLRMRVLPRFPAAISAVNGLKVTRPSGSPNLIVEPDFGSLVQIPSVDDPENVFFWAWDRSLSLYRIMSFADLFAGVTDLGFMTEAVYDPQNIHADAFARANHTGAQAISTITGLQTALDGKEVKTVYASKSGNYTALATDNNAVHRYTAAATVALTAAATLAANWHYTVTADGGTVTIDPNGSETINGLTTLTVPSGSSAEIICDGSNFFTVIKPTGWEVVPGGRVVASGITAINFTDLSAFKRLWITGTFALNTPNSVLMRTSTNNGSSYDSGASDYLNQDMFASGTTVSTSRSNSSALALNGTVSASASTINCYVDDFNSSALATIISSANNIVGGNESRFVTGSRLTSTARNAFQITCSGVTFSANLTVQGMRG